MLMKPPASETADGSASKISLSGNRIDSATDADDALVEDRAEKKHGTRMKGKPFQVVKTTAHPVFTAAP